RASVSPARPPPRMTTSEVSGIVLRAFFIAKVYRFPSRFLPRVAPGSYRSSGQRPIPASGGGRYACSGFIQRRQHEATPERSGHRGGPDSLRPMAGAAGAAGLALRVGGRLDHVFGSALPIGYRAAEPGRCHAASGASPIALAGPAGLDGAGRGGQRSQRGRFRGGGRAWPKAAGSPPAAGARARTRPVALGPEAPLHRR